MDQAATHSLRASSPAGGRDRARHPGGAARAGAPGAPSRGAYERPSVEVISLSCEISAYAPDEDGWPLF